MKSELSTVVCENPERPGGKVNPTRGEVHRASAILFGKAHPIGSDPIPVAAFDAFIVEHMGVVPAASLDRASDGWQAFVQRRGVARQNLNRAAAHPRMRDHGMTPYYLALTGRGMLKTLPVEEALAHDKSAAQVHSLVLSRKRKVDYLLQSVDYEVLPPSLQLAAGMLEENLHNYLADQKHIGDRLERSYQKLRSSLVLALESKQITPKNGGIRAVTDDSADVEVDGDDMFA
jgi:hypothetical protein